MSSRHDFRHSGGIRKDKGRQILRVRHNQRNSEDDLGSRYKMGYHCRKLGVDN
jgi:hypothetical protein